ncbi:MAG TPA: hypothetical protein VFN10_22715 [Thermoanaerobaculia bacterium]|nr:hypothetical protein [Thermoanaerobaculia bacterium]
MKRITIAALWLAAATLPLLASAVLLFGCCVLPLHGIVHKAMPLCHAAAAVMAGGATHDDTHPATPAHEKQEPVKRLVTDAPFTHRVMQIANVAPVAAPLAATAYRSFIAHGALRCDRDVGLHVLVVTFLI